MTEQHLDQARARGAYARLDELIGELFESDSADKQNEGDSRDSPGESGAGCKQLKEYRSVLLAAPVMLRRHGLLQSLAFWSSKNRKAEPWTCSSIVDWLAQAEPTRHLIGRRVPASDLTGWITQLAELPSSDLAVFEAEAVSYSGWLKRAVEGHWLAKDCSKLASDLTSSRDNRASKSDRSGESKPSPGIDQ